MSACSHTVYYSCSDFPMFQEKDSSSYSLGKIPLFKEKIYVMRIYQVHDTFSDDARQRYINHRTVQEKESVSDSDKVQTLCLIFLDSSRVLYYTMLQNNPSIERRKMEISDYPSKICLTDSINESDNPFSFKYKRHAYHGIYKFTSPNTLQIEFQKKNSTKQKKGKDIKLFSNLWCSVNPNGDISVDKIGYIEDNILVANSQVILNAEKIFGEKFKTVFSVVDIGNAQRNELLDIEYEVVYSYLTKKLAYRTYKDGKKTSEKDIDFAYLRKEMSKIKPKPDSAKIVDSFQVRQCVIRFPFLNGSRQDSAEITYFFKNSDSIVYKYKLSASIIGEMTKNKNLKYPNDNIIVKDRIMPKLSGIMDSLSPRNKIDLLDFVRTISNFDAYRVRVYKDSTWSGFLENNIAVIKRDSSPNLKRANPLSITYKLKSNKNAIQEIKKCAGGADRYKVKVEYEFKVTSIEEGFDALTGNRINKYYVGDTLIQKNKKLIFLNEDPEKPAIYIHNWKKVFSPKGKEDLSNLLDSINTPLDFKDEETNNEIVEDKNKRYYIKEQIIKGKDKRMPTW